MNRTTKRGFSLLEVIIATAILTASAMMLMSMFSMADRHANRAERRLIARMLCESKLDELLTTPETILPTRVGYFPNFPGWVWSLELQPTALDDFALMRVSVTHLPGQPVQADLEPRTAAAETTTTSVTTIPDTPTFSITRFMQFEGDIEGLNEESSLRSTTDGLFQGDL